MKTLYTYVRVSLILFLVTACFVKQGSSQALDSFNGDVGPQVKETSHGLVMGPVDANVLWDNGPLVTNPGAGFGGADVSLLQSISLAMNTLGFGHQYSLGYKAADDFIVNSPSGWDITGITFYAYQTGSTTNSTITGVYFAIYDGDPMQPGSTIVFGDFVTNRMTATGFSNIYRVTESDLLVNNRPIMTNYCDVNLHLVPGTYWIVWSTDGSLASGPWAPPVTVLGQTATGNGLQHTTAWGGAYDNVDITRPQGYPFIIYGPEPLPVVPVAGWALGIGLVLIIGLALLRYRRIV
jgi:hypothetical protein